MDQFTGTLNACYDEGVTTESLLLHVAKPCLFRCGSSLWLGCRRPVRFECFSTNLRWIYQIASEASSRIGNAGKCPHAGSGVNSVGKHSDKFRTFLLSVPAVVRNRVMTCDFFAATEQRCRSRFPIPESVLGGGVLVPILSHGTRVSIKLINSHFSP
jgi:hypothetical protein